MFIRLIKGLWYGFQYALGVAIALCYCLPTWLVLKAIDIYLYLEKNFRRILMKLLYIIMVCILIVLAYASVRTFIDDFRESQIKRKAELDCVAEMISSGHDRINIRTFDGTCTVEPNGYYK